MIPGTLIAGHQSMSQEIVHSYESLLRSQQKKNKKKEKKKSCWIMKETSPPIVIAEGIRDHSTGLYRLAKLKGGSVNMIKSSEMHLWHRRLGYINNISLHLLLR
uniref:Uncharacterized protein n=1 Tax=Physcomitrium patens TaxID=3218 RepID=A0A2K1KHI5_PHYPA|nr:hypothetical protein PHYPA_009620 [Physcomitrium patens]